MKIKRLGFTLVELLVVIAIIGVLVALLLPAVQAAREAGRRTQCKNNMKQIGLAFQNHYDALKVLPTGGSDWYTPRVFAGGTPANGAEQSWGWMYQILPYIEQDNLWSNPNDAFVQASTVKAYFCPSRRKPMMLTGAGDRGMNDYAGNGGLDPSNGSPMWSDGYNGVVVRNNTGPIGLEQLTDGTANTILAGEKRLDTLAIGSYQCDDNEGYSSGWDWDVIRWGNNPPQADPRSGDQCEVLFGAAHRTGAHFAIGDGSVKFVAYSVNQAVFQQACQRDDGQVSNLP